MQLFTIFLTFLSCLPVAPPAPGFDSVCLSPENVEQLTRLCVTECRGMEDAREDCCASSVSSALGRLYYAQENNRYYLAGETLDSVLGYHRENVWQFPPYAYRACDWNAGGVAPSSPACLEGEDHDWARQPVLDCVLSGECGTCPYRLYYGFKSFDSLPGACAIESVGGVHWYHNGWGAHSEPSWAGEVEENKNYRTYPEVQ